MAPIGLPDVGHLATIIEGKGGMLPAAMRDLARLLLDQSACLAQKIDGELRKRVNTHDTARRLKTICHVAFKGEMTSSTKSKGFLCH